MQDEGEEYVEEEEGGDDGEESEERGSKVWSRVKSRKRVRTI